MTYVTQEQRELASWSGASKSTKGQLNSERIYEIIVSPKMPTKNTKISALPSSKLVGQKSW